MNNEEERRVKLRELLNDSFCWSCGRDPEGSLLLSVSEAARYCGVSITAVRRWMDLGKVQWILTASGRRRIYLRSLVRVPGFQDQEEWNETL